MADKKTKFTFRDVCRFHASTILWLTLVVGSFFGGIYWAGERTEPEPEFWNPAHSPLVALTGEFDLEGDGQQGLDRIKKLVQNNGGTVVAFQEIDGSYHGVVDDSIQMLVVGAIETSDANEFVSAAEQLGIPLVPIDTLINRVPSSIRIERLNENETVGFRERR